MERESLLAVLGATSASGQGAGPAVQGISFTSGSAMAQSIPNRPKIRFAHVGEQSRPVLRDSP